MRLHLRKFCLVYQSAKLRSCEFFEMEKRHGKNDTLPDSGWWFQICFFHFHPLCEGRYSKLTFAYFSVVVGFLLISGQPKIIWKSFLCHKSHGLPRSMNHGYSEVIGILSASHDLVRIFSLTPQWSVVSCY